MKIKKSAIVMAATAAFFVGVQSANADMPLNGAGESDLQMEIFGGNHISSDESGAPTPLTGGPLTAIQSGKSKESRKSKGSRNPDFFSTAALAEAGSFDGCPFLGGAIVVTLVFIYDDGSLLSLTTDSSSFYCTDGIAFTTNLAGSVVGGNGRFEGSYGTWDGTSITFPGGRFTGEISVNLD